MNPNNTAVLNDEYNVAIWKLKTIVSILKGINIRTPSDAHVGSKNGIPTEVMSVYTQVELGKKVDSTIIDAAFKKAFIPEIKSRKKSAVERLGSLITNIGHSRKELLNILKIQGIETEVVSEILNNVPLTKRELLHIGIDISRLIQIYLANELNTAKELIYSKKLSIAKGRLSNRVYGTIRQNHKATPELKAGIIEMFTLQEILLKYLYGSNVNTFDDITLSKYYKLSQWQPISAIEIPKLVNQLNDAVKIFEK